MSDTGRLSRTDGMVDRTTKALLLAIALALWMNVVGPWVRPVPIQAAAQSLTDLYVSEISSHVSRISRGTCVNRKIC